MKSLLRTLLSAALLLLAAAPLAAQDEPQLFALDEAASFTVEAPAGAELFPVSEFADLFGDLNGLEGTVVTLEETVILVVTPEQVATVTEIPVGDDIETEAYVAALDEVMHAVYDNVVPEEEVTLLEAPIGGHLTVTWRYFGFAREMNYEAETSLLITDPAAGEAFFVDIVAPDGELDATRDAVDAMFASLSRAGASGGEPCSVSTGQFRSATVRVGPGEHRTALLFLEPNQGFPVEGRFVADDGTVWYRLVKDEVDPGSSAAELWVAAEGLTEVGGCATVGEAAAPPLRPIIAPRPTSVPGGGGDSGGSDTGAGPITPRSGTWVVTYASQGIASCEGGESFEIRSADFYISTEIIPIESKADGSAFTVDQLVYARISDTTFFLSVYNYEGWNTQVYFYPETPDLMHGEYRFNYQFSGDNCSGTFTMIAVRQ